MLWAASGTVSVQKYFAFRIHKVFLTSLLCWNKNSNQRILHRLKGTKINNISLQILISASTWAVFCCVDFSILILEGFMALRNISCVPLGFRYKPSHNSIVSEYQPATSTECYKTSLLSECLYSLLVSRTELNNTHHSAAQFSELFFS